MGLPEHVRGTDWPTCPFICPDDFGVFIRWNNNDLVQVRGESPQGDEFMETVEHWSPSHKIEQALRLWSAYPPQNQWLELQIGKDGWFVKLLYHFDKDTKMGWTTDDDGPLSLPEAITQAWVKAMESPS